MKHIMERGRLWVSAFSIGRHDPSPSMLIRLAKALEVTVGKLVE